MMTEQAGINGGTAMKRFVYLLGAALLAAVACNKEIAAPVEDAPAEDAASEDLKEDNE